MVLTLMIPARKWLKLHDLITLNPLDNIAKILLLTGTLVGYAYGMEFFIAWYSGSPYERFAFINRAIGPFAWGYWVMIGVGCSASYGGAMACRKPYAQATTIGPAGIR